jgi:hypothetical protein
MKGQLLLFFILLNFGIFSQENNLGLEYSFNLKITNQGVYERIKDNPEFQFSKYFKVFYTEKGALRFIEKSNNYIQSSIFNNKINELVLFEKGEIISKKTGNYNKPEIKSESSETDYSITYTTKTGIYNYYYNPEKLKFNSVNLNNLGEHCLNKFILETGVLPEKIVLKLGFIQFIMELKRTISLNSKDIVFLNKIIERPNKKGIKKFIEFSKRK